MDQQAPGTNQCHFTEWLHSITFALVPMLRHTKEKVHGLCQFLMHSYTDASLIYVN